ncbi:MAG: hypothetical protein ACYSU7_18310, partial [Planctomycetota bacterium]
GSAYVLRRNPGTGVWSQEAKLVATDAQFEDFFGQAVALDGEVAVIGATGDDDRGDRAGAAYVYRFDTDAGEWVGEGKLLASDGAADAQFGSSVAVSGGVIVIGAPGDDNGGSGLGAVYAFRYDSGAETWVEEQKIPAPGGGAAPNAFGSAVAAYGHVLVAGAPSTGPENLAGAAYVYRFSPGSSTWALEDTVSAPSASAYDGFGSSVAIDGTAIIAGAPSDNGIGQTSGSAFVFRYNGATWPHEQTLQASDGAGGDAFGMAVDIHGPLAIVGATGTNDYGPSSGSAYVYRDDDGSWPEAAKLLGPGQETFNLFGLSVALQGTTAIVGSLANGGQGSVYVFDGLSGRDCNDNGELDDCEILSGQADDDNGNGVPDECDMPGDIDGDGIVGVTDFLMMLSAWGACPAPCPPACPGDLDDDCVVGVNDFLLLLSLWG